MAKQHQRIAQFSDEILKVLSEDDKTLLNAGDFQSDAVRTCVQRLCEVLLNYCSYRVAPIEHQSINPFDDPFVGAALMNGDGKVISGHRKEGRNEPHAEVETLLG